MKLPGLHWVRMTIGTLILTLYCYLTGKNGYLFLIFHHFLQGLGFKVITEVR